ncbi:Bax inhibitor-1/YccA family protein [Corynebacterium phoceense]|uniref:Bax inhibitor-1/YccA family protein n=1 Tax=Corynebacterium phoceense TaxID=1686286 RepID=UPI0034CD4FAF
MRSSNPVMNSLTSSSQDSYSANPYAGSSFDGNHYAQQGSAERPMTVDDVVTKTGITLAVIIVGAIVNFGIAIFVSPGLASLLTLVGALGGFVTVLVATFGKKWGSATTTLIYAVFEGLFVGGFSFMFTNVTVGGASAASLIGQAVLGTVGVFIGMLFVYKTGAVRVTPKFNKIMLGALVGVAVLALGNLLLALFTGFSPLRDGGPLAIIFSLVCIVLGALSFLTDFDQADRLIRAQAPARNAWGVALGLAVTLVWLYTEILRLLSYFQNR